MVLPGRDDDVAVMFILAMITFLIPILSMPIILIAVMPAEYAIKFALWLSRNLEWLAFVIFFLSIGLAGVLSKKSFAWILGALSLIGAFVIMIANQ